MTTRMSPLRGSVFVLAYSPGLRPGLMTCAAVRLVLGRCGRWRDAGGVVCAALDWCRMTTRMSPLRGSVFVLAYSPGLRPGLMTCAAMRLVFDLLDWVSLGQERLVFDLLDWVSLGQGRLVFDLLDWVSLAQGRLAFDLFDWVSLAQGRPGYLCPLGSRLRSRGEAQCRRTARRDAGATELDWCCSWRHVTGFSLRRFVRRLGIALET